MTEWNPTGRVDRIGEVQREEDGEFGRVEFGWGIRDSAGDGAVSEWVSG